MTDFSEIAGDVLGAVLGVFIGLSIALLVLVAVSLLLPFLRARFSPIRIERLGTTPDLSPEQLCAADELAALGFLQTGVAIAHSGALKFNVLCFRHRTAPAFAALILSRDARIGFPAVFYSFDTDGSLLLTTNRKGWLFPAQPPGVSQSDGYATNLAAHWEAHLARLADDVNMTMSGDEAEQRLFSAAQDYFAFLEENNYIVKEHGRWRPSWRTAFWQTRDYLRNIRRLIPRYISPVTCGEHQDNYDIAAYQELDAKQAAPRTARTKAWLLVISALTSLPLWGLTLGWKLAVPLMIILAVHEAGHALAMWVFGYRNITMMFVPLLGALVTGTPKQIAVWKQSIMLLAGPVPGFVLAAGALLYLKHHPLHAWGIEWTRVAAVAAVVNFINLLPITPLDGGRLIEIGLFNRWPRARLIFVVLSVIVIALYAQWEQNFALLLLSGLLLGNLLSQRRITKLQSAWKEGLSQQDQVKHLFEVARNSFSVQSFAQLRPLVKAVFTMRAVQQPRIWESIAIVSALSVLWSSAALGFYILKQKPDTSTVSNNMLQTRSTAILPCKNEGDFSKAMRICTELLDKGQIDKASQVMAYDKLAEIALIRSDYNASVMWSEKAIHANPGFPYHYYLAAEAYTKLKQFNQAIKFYDEAITAMPAFFQALHRRGEVYLALGDITNAKRDFKAALSLNKDFKPALLALARLRQ